MIYKRLFKRIAPVLFSLTFLLFFQSCTKDGTTIELPPNPGDVIIVEDWTRLNKLQRERENYGTRLIKKSEINERLENKGYWFMYLKYKNGTPHYIPPYDYENADSTQFIELDLGLGENFTVQELSFAYVYSDRENYGYSFGIRRNSPDDLNTTDYQVRAFFIPAKLYDKDVNYENYREVQKFFEITD